MTIILLLLILVVCIGIWFYKRSIYTLAKRYTSENIESVLFNNCELQKEQIIASMQKITSNKYSKEDLLDYFIKIKGLQVMKFSGPINFWTRKYLTSPTRLKLNYFEQVKFYEMFLNYPPNLKSTENDTNQNYLSPKKNQLLLHEKQLA